MNTGKILPIFLMSSVLVACGGGTGASLSGVTTGTNASTSTSTSTTTTGSGSTTTDSTSTTTGSGASESTNGTTTDSTANSNTLSLTRNAVDAEYSDALERLITVSSSPDNALNIINPTTGEQQAVPLNLAPTSLAISPDGKTAVVGHSSGVTHINLQTASVLDFYDNIGFSVFDIALSGNGMAYATPASNALWGVLKAINLGTGEVKSSLSVVQMGGSYLQLAPNQNALYIYDKSTLPVDLIKTDTASPPAGLYDSPYNGEYDIGGSSGKGLWLTEDGGYILTAGETLFSTATTQDQDMLYQRSLSDDDNDPNTRLLHADNSQEAAKFVVILDKGITGTGSEYSLKTYAMPTLNLLDEKPVSDLKPTSTSDDPVIPQFVFFNSDGTKRYAVLKQGTGTYLINF
ncbi:MAG: WD40 repeat domain-containing protein [Thiothrix litoralis]|uniref:YncE family protein n=1 Tax=Thiothrix litoralis TaxID=2891210 RepID=UPI003C7832DF